MMSVPQVQRIGSLMFHDMILLQSRQRDNTDHITGEITAKNRNTCKHDLVLLLQNLTAFSGLLLCLYNQLQGKEIKASHQADTITRLI
jgi:hypothetical protein